MTEERNIETVKCVNLVNETTCVLQLTGQSLSFSNRCSTSSSASLSLAEVLRLKLFPGARFESTTFYGPGGYFYRQEHHFDKTLTNADDNKAWKLQESI